MGRLFTLFLVSSTSSTAVYWAWCRVRSSWGSTTSWRWWWCWSPWWFTTSSSSTHTPGCSMSSAKRSTPRRLRTGTRTRSLGRIKVKAARLRWAEPGWQELLRWRRGGGRLSGRARRRRMFEWSRIHSTPLTDSKCEKKKKKSHYVKNSAAPEEKMFSSSYFCSWMRE